MPTADHVEESFKAHLSAERWQEAVAVLVEHYGDEVLRFLYGFLRDGDAAEEVFSRLCLWLCEEIPRFRGECAGRSWFYYKARYMALDFRRAAARHRERRLETAELSRIDGLAAQVRTRTRPYLRTEVKDRFAQLRQQLSDEEQTLLVLYKYQRMSSQEVAEAMSTPDDIWTPQRVRKRWQRLKETITALAARQGLIDPEAD